MSVKAKFKMQSQHEERKTMQECAAHKNKNRLTVAPKGQAEFPCELGICFQAWTKRIETFSGAFTEWLTATSLHLPEASRIGKHSCTERR